MTPEESLLERSGMAMEYHHRLQVVPLSVAQEILAAALSQAEAYRVDAERWREARKHAVFVSMPEGDSISFDLALPWPKATLPETADYMDSAIDTARKPA